MWGVYFYLGSYVLLLLVVSYAISKKQSDEDFLISGRNRGGWQILASKFATAIGAAYFVTYTGFSYEYGIGVFAMLLGIAMGYLLFAYWASPKIHEFSKQKKFYTMGDFVNHKINSKAGMQLTNILSNVILFFWLLVGIVAGAKIIADFGFLSYEIAVLLTVVVVLGYILMAGFKAVIITDVIQAIIILGLTALITLGIIGGGLSGLFSVQTGRLNITTALSFFFFGLLALFSYSNQYQLCYAADTKRKLKHGLGLAIIPIILVGAMLLIIGLFMAANVPGLDSGLVFTEALKNFLPASLLPLGIVLFFAGIMSSADTNIYGISSHYSIPKNGNSIRHIRKSSVWLMIITAVVALIFSDVVDASILAGGLSLTLSLPMIYILAGGKSSKRFIASTVLSLVGLLMGIAIFGIEPTAAVTTLLGGIIGLFYPIKKQTKP